MTNISDPIKQKKFFVNIQGKDYEVSLEKKKWVIMHGEDNLIIKDGEIALKPAPTPRTKHKILKKAEKGYFFQCDDIHWPNGVKDNGETWLIEYE